MKFFSFRNIIVALAFVTALYAVALDLPVKRVSGTDYYYYNVERNESLADIARKFNITRDGILRNNPGASDGLKPGMTLYFPVYEFAEDNIDLPGQSTGQTGTDSPTRYKVQKGETLYGIARRFDITPDEIVSLNPEAASGVRAGQMLLIPHPGMSPAVASQASNSTTVPSVIPIDQPADVQDDSTVNEYATNADIDYNNLKKSDSDPTSDSLTSLPESDDDSDLTFIESLDNDSLAVIDIPSIALMLPLMLNEQGESKQGRLSADFIRGFILGVKSLSDAAFPTNINIYDTESNLDKTNDIYNQLGDVENLKIIIANDEASFSRTLPSFVNENSVYALNIFASHDTTYLVNPYFMQANIPAKLMYKKAAQALMNAFTGYTPVFLVSKGGRGEKYPFTSYLQEQYAQAGITPIELTYEGMLTSADVETIDLSQNHVFIPASGALSEFNKFAHTLITLRENAADPSSIALFGYPDWTTFRGEALENLHRLGAIIYSRFYCNNSDDDIRSFNEDFEDAYGTHSLEQVPSQALLGYDTARYILTNLKNNEGEFEPFQSTPFRGLQSTFMFTDASDDEESESGYVNTSLYIITFLPGERIAVQVL